MITQRPAHLHGDVWSGPTAVWIHPLLGEADREKLERGLGITLRGRTREPVTGTDGRPHATAPKPLVYSRDFCGT